MLVPFVGGRIHRLWKTGKLRDIRSFQALIREFERPKSGEETQPILHPDQDEGLPQETRNTGAQEQHEITRTKLGFKETANLSLEFCIIWVSRTF